MITTLKLREVSVRLDDEGDGPALLLLHGFPATRHLWSLITPQLVGAGFRVLVPDLVGYGESVAPPGVRTDMGSQAGWMCELLERLSVEQPTLIAHDVGSAAAQLMVTSAPTRFRALAVLDGVHLGEWAMGAIASIQSWDPQEAHRLAPVLARRLGKSAELRAMLSGYQGSEGGMRLIRAARDLDPGQTASLGAQLRACGIPAAVLWGERDEYLPLESVGRPLAELLRVPLTTVPGGHFTPLDCPAEVAAALLAFLARLAPQRNS